MEFMSYKGYPLARKGDELYYGYMSEPYVIMLHIEQAKEIEGISVSQKVTFYQMSTDEKRNPIEAIVKHGERNTLLDALNVGYTWLERAMQ